jgi:mono/diheme cytochrome c family protein
MNAKRLITLAAFGFALLVGVAAAQDKAAAPAADAKDGKALFLEGKCNTCHTIKAAEVTKRKAAASDAAEEKEKSDKEAPDLSSIGLERKADWMAKYLMKKEAIKGEKHGRRFRGTEAELVTVTTWLEAQKAAKPKKK